MVEPLYVCQLEVQHNQGVSPDITTRPVAMTSVDNSLDSPSQYRNLLAFGFSDPASPDPLDIGDTLSPAQPKAGLGHNESKSQPCLHYSRPSADNPQQHLTTKTYLLQAHTKPRSQPTFRDTSQTFSFPIQHLLPRSQPRTSNP
jgi:hypothetical protein